MKLFCDLRDLAYDYSSVQKKDLSNKVIELQSKGNKKSLQIKFFSVCINRNQLIPNL